MSNCRPMPEGTLRLRQTKDMVGVYGLEVLPGVRQHKLFESHFRVDFGRGTYGYQTLVALHRAIRLWCGYGFESCNANGPRNVKTHKPCETKTFFWLTLPDDGKESVWKVPKRGQFHAAIRVTISHCDSCTQRAPGRQMVPLRRNMPQSIRPLGVDLHGCPTE